MVIIILQKNDADWPASCILKNPKDYQDSTILTNFHNQLLTQTQQLTWYLSFIELLPHHSKQKAIDILSTTIRFLFKDYKDPNFLYDFVYHSNKSEGSKIAYEDFISIIHHQKPSTNNRNEIQEVKNSFLARDFLMNGFVRNEASIKRLHKILTMELVGDNGRAYQTWYKQYNNIVGNATTTDHTSVAQSMQYLLSRYKVHKKVMFPLHLAFEFHYRFERIHPFADGNGRIGRLLMNKILHDHKFIPLTIFSENRSAYFRTFEQSMERWSQILYAFLIDQYKKTLKTIE